MSIFGNDKPEELGIFNKGEETTPVVSSETSDAHLSAQASVMSPNETVQEYQELSLSYGDDKDAALLGKSAQRRVESDTLQNQTALNIMADASVPEETRLQVGAGLSNNTSANKSTTRMLYEDLIAKESEGESEDQAEGRIKLVDILDDLEERRQAEQSALNGNQLSTSESGWNTAGDFAELFIPFDETVFTESFAAKLREGSAADIDTFRVMLGNRKAEIRDWAATLDFNQQTALMSKAAEMLNNTRGIVFTNDNDLLQKISFIDMFDPNSYTDGWQFADNLISVMEMSGALLPVAKFVKGTVIGARATAKVEKAISRVKNAARRSDVQPASVARTASDVNPSEARKMATASIVDETGEVAKATHGTSREDVIIDADAPQIRYEDGSIDMAPFTIRTRIDKLMQRNLLDYSAEERVSQHLATVAEFADEFPVHLHNSSPAPKFLDNGQTEFNNVYSTPNGGWTTPAKALEEVQSRFRQYDVNEEDFVLMQKSGTQYVETTLKEVEAKQALRDQLVKAKKKLPEELKKVNMVDDFVVKVKFTRDFDPNKVKHERLSYSKNFLDRVPAFAASSAGGSSITRNLFDPASIFDPRIFLSANVAIDRSSAIEADLVKLADLSFGRPMRKLPKERQELLGEIIKEQNLLETRFDAVQLEAKGVTKEEQKILDGWRDVWDTVWILENRDLRNTLSTRGYQIFRDSISETELVAKPIKNPNKSIDVYNATSGQIESMGPKSLKDLYESGGTVAELRSPLIEEGMTAEFVISKGTKENNLKEITSGDIVLPYKKGYYHVKYKDPHFIIEKFTDASGKEITRAVKTAGSTKEADRIVEKLSKNADEGVTYYRREDKSTTTRDAENDVWDLNVASGRSSQKVRGQRLGTEDKLQDAPIQGPVESLLASARSIARRMSLRGYIDDSKTRFMDEFDEILSRDPKTGVKRYPKSIDELRGANTGSQYRKILADARTYWEYINSIEVGYRNGLDEVWRASLNGIAEAIGTKSASAEKLTRDILAELESPTGWIRGRAFDAYLATNPFRQFIVQSHQATLLAVNFPEYVFSQKLARDMSAVHLAMFGEKGMNNKAVQKLTGMTLEEARKLRDEYLDTGLDASIDMNNLVEKSLDQLVESSNFKTIKKLHGKIVGTLREVGFDAGERINIMSSWLAHRDQAIKAGKDLNNITVQAEIVGRARNYTLNMNKAGEMPYNKNSLSLLFQFMQVPHKMVTTILFNKALKPAEKVRLGAYNMIMLPLPIGLTYSILGESDLPKDSIAREVIVNGVEGAIINKLAQLTFDDDTSISFSSFTTADTGGLYDLLASFVSADLTEIAANAPSLSLVMGNAPRMGTLLHNTARVFAEPTMENFGTAAHKFASVSSGYANFSQFYEELFVDEVNKRYSQGKVAEEDMTVPESIAKLFGFNTTQQHVDYEIKRRNYQESKTALDDVEKFYKLRSRLMVDSGVNKDDPDYAIKMINILEENTSAFWSVASTYKLKQHYLKLIQKDLQLGDKDNNMFGLIIRGSGIRPVADLKVALSNAGLDPRLLDDIGNYTEEDK